EQLAAAAAAAQAQTVGAVLRLLERLAAAPVLQTANREPCAALLDGAARLEPRIREIAALGEAGTIRCGAPSAAPADVTALLRQRKGGTALSLQPPEPGAAAGTGEWTVAVPIRNAEGDVAGALRARLAADPLDGPIPGQTLPEGAYRLLVNAAGE